MQVCRIPFIFCQPLVFAFSRYMTRLVEYEQGWLNWAFSSIIILTNPSSSRLHMRFKVIGSKVWCFLQDICLAYRSLNLSPISIVLLNPPISLSSGYIHLYWIGLHTHASYAKCIGKCSVESKNPGEKILSNLHRIIKIFFFITNR